MKKSTILIAMFTVIAATSAVKAEMAIDFDGKSAGSLRTVNFGIANAEINREIPNIPAPAIVSGRPQAQDIDSISSEELAKLDNRLNSSIKTAITYCDKSRLGDLRNSFAELLAHGTLKEKYGFVYNNANRYVFQNKEPLGTAIMNASLDQPKGGNPYCVAWGKQNVCVDKQVCKYTCIIVGATVATWGSVNGIWQIIIPAAVGTEVCKDICANVPICADVPYCTQWETEVI